ncbi:hypothetical protein VPNG_01520 [Cytospora leucostoma]|uniref:Uncharacterized protein n=1 Tax=Cytospora leucostoma TaxID=1230097 RepID=A0A423XKB5_9PEZI|nr:hypothetical protein VPNG_01520 [Cytospora leucostoma]
MAGTDENATPPATPKPAAGGAASLTARESEILHAALNCLKAPLEIDYDVLAGQVGMSNPRSASNAWSVIKKKMGWNVKAGDTPATGKSTGGGAKRKKDVVAGDAGDDGDNDGGEGTPVKKAKTPTKPRKKAAATPKKAAATPKKGKAASGPKSSSIAKESSDEDELAQEKVGKVVKEEQVANSLKTEEESNDYGEV